MILDLALLFDGTNDAISFSENLSLSDEQASGEISFPTGAYASGTIALKGGAAILSYTLKADVSALCTRCLTNLLWCFEKNITHELRAQNEEIDDGSFILLDGSKLDLKQLIYEDLFLNLPLQNICMESCKGLCSSCGANLNENPCDCKPEKGDLRLAALSKLLK